MSGLLGDYLGQETIRAVRRGMQRPRAGHERGAGALEGGGPVAAAEVESSSASRLTGAVLEPDSAKVDSRGLTPAMRELLESKPETPSPLPALDFIVGSRIELCNLTGSERNWNGRRGVVTAKHLSMHPQNKNVRAWVLEIAFDKPISKTAFFSDYCRLVSPYEPSASKKQQKKIKPNAPCPCGSGKKFKKCCGGKNAKKATSGASTDQDLGSQHASYLRNNPPLKNRPKLRFKVGDEVQAFAGAGEWINGTIIKLWDEGNPYRIELEDGTNVWGPEDVSNFVRPRNISKSLRFKVGDRVLANALGGWKNGKIIRIWDHGNPYRIELEDGTNVWGPEDVDKFVRPLDTK